MQFENCCRSSSRYFFVITDVNNNYLRLTFLIEGKERSAMSQLSTEDGTSSCVSAFKKYVLKLQYSKTIFYNLLICLFIISLLFVNFNKFEYIKKECLTDKLIILLFVNTFTSNAPI